MKIEKPHQNSVKLGQLEQACTNCQHNGNNWSSNTGHNIKRSIGLMRFFLFMV